MLGGRRAASTDTVIVVTGIAALLVHRYLPDDAPQWALGSDLGIQVAAIVWLLGTKLQTLPRAVLTIAVAAAIAAGLTSFGVSISLAQHLIAGICHAATYATLLIWFTLSLRTGQEPVVTHLARRVRRTMPLKVIIYTRRVTVAWCIFFGTQLLLSGILLIVATPSVWASFVIVWNLPTVVAMILLEFACRRVLFRKETRTSLLATFAAMRNLRGIRP